MSHDHLSHEHHNHMSHGVGAGMGQMDHSGHMGHDMKGMNMSNCSGHHMDMDMSMSMWFHLGYKETILFEFWKVSTIYGLVGSMIGICIMAALYEGLKYYREHLFWHSYNALQYRSVQMPVDKNSSDRVVQPSMFSKMHAFQTFLHIVQMVISYFLMLIFMTYNVYLCIAVVVGAGIGYFLFGWKKSVIVDVTEHCH